MKDELKFFLKRQRIKRGWSKTYTANKIGISRSYYTDLENGKYFPSQKTILKIYRVFPFFITINDGYTEQIGGELNVQ